MMRLLLVKMSDTEWSHLEDYAEIVE
jgi:hypothetical protein